MNYSYLNSSLRLLVPCNWARKSYIMSWSCQYASNLCLKMLVLLAVTIQFGKLLQASTTQLVKSNLRRSYLKWVLKILKSLPLVAMNDSSIKIWLPRWCHISQRVSYMFLPCLLLLACNARLTYYKLSNGLSKENFQSLVYFFVHVFFKL